MSVLINFKICDNSEDCDGIEVCSIGAFYWDREKRTIAVDNSKCTDCGRCEEACPVDAIRVAKTKEEYEKIKNEIEKDLRKVSDLFVDRYGAQPISSAFLIPESKFDIQILRSTKPVVLELFEDDSIQCLLRSISLKELFKGLDIKYRKMKAEGGSFLKKYGVKELPALLFFKDGKLTGKIEGYFENKKKEELIMKINKILRMAKA